MWHIQPQENPRRLKLKFPKFSKGIAPNIATSLVLGARRPNCRCSFRVPRRCWRHRAHSVIQASCIVSIEGAHHGQVCPPRPRTQAGKTNIIRTACRIRLPICWVGGNKYRLTKGATFPILAAFRAYVEPHPKTGEARWRGGFQNVRDVWKESRPNLVDETFQLTREGKCDPDQIGKDRKHWGNLYMRLQVRLLHERLMEQQERPPRRRR